ncbi:MAG: hypothetical protein C0499_05695 [Zymomonas sp.]|nr:hypothetical protein [Zymomonas sp.]
MHDGYLREWCWGCERNRSRAGMGLSPLDFTPREQHEPERARGHGRGGQRRREDSVAGRIARHLPTSPRKAYHYTEIAHALGVNEQYVNDSLHVLRARGIAECVEGKHPRQRKRTSLRWYRADRRAA